MFIVYSLSDANSKKIFFSVNCASPDIYCFGEMQKKCLYVCISNENSAQKKNNLL